MHNLVKNMQLNYSFDQIHTFRVMLLHVICFVRFKDPNSPTLQSAVLQCNSDMTQGNDSGSYNVINVVANREFNKYVSCNDSIMSQWLKTNQAWVTTRRNRGTSSMRIIQGHHEHYNVSTMLLLSLS